MKDKSVTASTPVSSSIGQLVYSKIRQSILSGYYRPGQRLTEIALAEEMQASRTPVVNALKALTEQGLVRFEANRGYWVREFHLGEVLEAYDIRASLEGLACRQAAEKGVSRPTLEAMDECIRIRTGERGSTARRGAARCVVNHCYAFCSACTQAVTPGCAGCQCRGKERTHTTTSAK